jgi:tetratricopeptide (TPR) repeat protein
MAPTQAGGGGAPMVAEINALKRRLQENPSDVQAATRLANLFHDAQIWDQAVMFYEQAIELSPNDPDLLTDLGICYRSLQRYDDALEKFARAREASPGHWQSLFNTAVVAAFDLGEYERALEALNTLEGEMSPVPSQVTQLKEAVVHAKEQTAGPAGS